MKVGFTASTFDLLHAGHVAMLSEAKNVCDFLLVGLHVNPNEEREEKNRPIQTLVERYTQLKAISYVDEIIPYQKVPKCLEGRTWTTFGMDFMFDKNKKMYLFRCSFVRLFRNNLLMMEKPSF